MNGNGHHANGLPRTGYGGHDDLFGIGPTVELTPVNGNGNGHHVEAEEPQQSLFSWAEFMGRGAGEAEAQER